MSKFLTFCNNIWYRRRADQDSLPKKLTTKSQFLFENMLPGDVAIDCGANVGEVTAQMAAKGATVHAFEPHPKAFAALQQRFAGQPNVHCINKAVLDRHCQVKLYQHQKHREDELYWSPGSSILDFKANIDRTTWIETETVDLCEFVEGIDQPVKLLKIDVEGAECEILERMLERETYKKVGMIVVETHDHKIPELKPRTDRLRQAIKDKGINNINLDWT